MQKAFELWMGCFGNGITVCNKAVEEHGDYKKIAHISRSGKITFYVPVTDIPEKDLLKIRHKAKEQQEKFEQWFSSLTEYGQYEYLLDRASFQDFTETINMNVSRADKIRHLKEVLWEKGRL